MKLLVPYVTLSPQLPETLERQGVAADYVDTSGAEDYWAVLARYWDEGETFIVLEQDKIPAPGALIALWECAQPWCVYPVAMRGVAEVARYPTLSCAKFGASLMQADPDLLRKVGELDLGFGEREWSRLDMGIAAFCENITPAHWHEAGKIEHLH